MAQVRNISFWMTLACALALGAHVARASESLAANPLRESVVTPERVTPASAPLRPLVEFGPVEAQAQEQAEQEATATLAAPEDRRLGSPALPLRARERTDARTPDGERASASGSTGLTQGARTLGALAAVIALIFVARWVIRRCAQRGGLVGQLGAGGRAPSGVLEVLGRFPVSRGQSLVLLRLDRRVLLLSQSSQGFTTLSEIDDPQEVASLVVKTADDESATLAARFRAILSSFERDPSIAGEVEEVGGRSPTTLRLARQRRDDVIDVTGEEGRRGALASVRRRLAILRDEEAA